MKFYAAQGMVDLVPYQCVQDFIVSDLQGTGLTRQGNTGRRGDSTAVTSGIRKGELSAMALPVFVISLVNPCHL